MSAASDTLVKGTSVQTLVDRNDITEVLNRYSSSVDSFDYAGVRSALADDIQAQYANAPAVSGGDALAKWIEEATATVIWQHHLLSVYHVDVDGDDTTALSYLTSLIRRGDLVLELDEKLVTIARICLPRFVMPPMKALYLQLYHTLNGVGTMMINGRTYMGNTPTMVAGRETRMRFGVVGMGNSGSGFHTFHIHGHRWIIPGPQGNTPGAIQGSPQVQAVSQFEDTRIFGPANSFVFTINGNRAASCGPAERTPTTRSASGTCTATS